MLSLVVMSSRILIPVKLDPIYDPFPKVHSSYHAKKLMALHSKAAHNS